MKDRYHHGDLRHDLIEHAIQIISENGFEQLTLRGAAKQCGVSHNAVYRHFESKEQLIDTCRMYVTELLTAYLEDAVKDQEPASPGTLRELSRAYVRFYLEHPTYFSSLYRNSPVKLQLTMEDTEENYPPFELFRKSCRSWAEARGRSDAECLDLLARTWSLAHGLTSLLISPNVEGTLDWEQCLDTAFLQETGV